MKNQSKFRLLTLAGVFALLTISLSSCFYGGYGRDRYYSRPSYGYRPYMRPQTRVYVAPQRRYYKHDNYRRNYGSNNRNYRGGNNRGGNSRNGRH